VILYVASAPRTLSFDEQRRGYAGTVERIVRRTRARLRRHYVDYLTTYELITSTTVVLSSRLLLGLYNWTRCRSTQFVIRPDVFNG